jgi:hypothetical protein
VKLKLEEAHGNKLFVLRVSDYQVQTSNDKKQSLIKNMQDTLIMKHDVVMQWYKFNPLSLADIAHIFIFMRNFALIKLHVFRMI